MYGQQYREQISEVIRHAAELCDCLQCFFLIHSMGGGQYFVCCKDVEMQCHLLQYFIMKMSTYFKYCKINYLIYTPYQKKASCLIDAPLQS